MSFDYLGACAAATKDQGLAPFAEAEGWTVEQTGGFTMVAVAHMPDGSVWTVTRDGSEDAPYFAVHSPLSTWRGETEDTFGERYLTLADALGLAS